MDLQDQHRNSVPPPSFANGTLGHESLGTASAVDAPSAALQGAAEALAEMLLAPHRAKSQRKLRPQSAATPPGGLPAARISASSAPLGTTARFVAIAGNIGAGKSTLTAFLESNFQIKPFYEPNDANPYLTDFYADMRSYGFHSQIYFLSAKFRAHLELARRLGAEPAVTFVQDRTIYEDAEIFARTLHTRGILSDRDFATYDSMYRGIRDALPRPDLLIYLRCSLKGLRRRIKLRGRPEEQAMDPVYLKALQDAYEAWFADYDLGPTVVIDSEHLDYLRNIVDRIDLVEALSRLLKR